MKTPGNWSNQDAETLPEKKDIAGTWKNCKCFHAPEQHGEDGCLAVNMAGEKCDCGHSQESGYEELARYADEEIRKQAVNEVEGWLRQRAIRLSKENAEPLEIVALMAAAEDLAAECLWMIKEQ